MGYTVHITDEFLQVAGYNGSVLCGTWPSFPRSCWGLLGSFASRPWRSDGLEVSTGLVGLEACNQVLDNSIGYSPYGSHKV
jgi:hypothetical protein